MALFLTILEGEDPATAVPLIATEDLPLIRLVGRELARRLGVDPQTQRRLLRRIGDAAMNGGLSVMGQGEKAHGGEAAG